jgi:hypothetical protein
MKLEAQSPDESRANSELDSRVLLHVIQHPFGLVNSQVGAGGACAIALVVSVARWVAEWVAAEVGKGSQCRLALEACHRTHGDFALSA